MFKMKRNGKVFKFHIYLTLLIIISNAIDLTLQDEDFQLEGYKKDAAGSKPRRPRPRPRPSPPSAPDNPALSSQFASEDKEDVPSAANPCTAHSNDLCLCGFDPKCEINELTGKCVLATNQHSEKFQCFRENTYYAFNTNLTCLSTKTSENCKDSTSVYSVNLNGQQYDDSTGTHYKSDKTVIVLDMHQLNVPAKPNCRIVGLKSKQDGDKLYKTFIEGNVDHREPGLCVSYPIPIMQGGIYELTIKTVAEMGKCMDIKLGGVTAASDLNLLELAHKQNCKALDVILLFFVDDIMRNMHINGHQTPVPINGGFSLKFCFGNCPSVPDATYRASGFSLVRFGQGSKIFNNMEMTVLTYGDGTQVFKVIDLFQKVDQAQIQLRYDSNTHQTDLMNQIEIKSQLTKDIKKEIEEDEIVEEQLNKVCPKIPNADEVGCRKAKCSFNLATKTCSSNKRSCALFQLGLVDCFHGKSYYGTGGVLCKTFEQQGKCDVLQIISAVNFFGNPYIDSNGVDYTSGKIEMSKLDFESTAEFVNLNTATSSSVCRDSAASALKISDNGSDDLELYKTAVVAKNSNPLTLNFPIQEVYDGFYELSIKTIEPFWKESGQRAFSILINGETVIKNLDIVSHVGSCTGMNLLIQLQVSQSYLTITGFQGKLITIPDNILVITFTNGDGTLGHMDPKFIFSAISLLKLEGKENAQNSDNELQKTSLNLKRNKVCEDPSICNKSAKECFFAGHEFNVITQQCIKTPTNCDEHLTQEISTCRKINVTYVSAGVPCRNKITSGNCEDYTIIQGLNLNGQDHEDSLGIYFKAENNLAIDINSTRRTGTETNICADNLIPKHDADLLYSTYIYGDGRHQTCIIYDVTLCQTGLYQLQFKLADTAPAFFRCFDIMIDETVLMVGIDISKMGLDIYCPIVDLTFPFKAELSSNDGEYMLTFEGHEESLFIKQKFQIKFCACAWETVRPTYKVSAFSLIRFGEGGITCNLCDRYNGNEADCLKYSCEYIKDTGICKPIEQIVCPSLNEQENLCKEKGCEYNLIDNTCESGLIQGGGKCDSKDFNLFSNCKRPNSYYVNAGVFCLNIVEDGADDSDTACASATAIWAYNLNGGNFTNERKTQFLADNLLYVYDPFKIRMPINFARYCPETDDVFTKFYAKAISANPTKQPKEGCLSYFVPLCQGGFYELSFFLTDGQYEQINKRCFDININDVTIASAIDPAKLGAMGDAAATKKCARNEIIVLFQVDQAVTQLTPQGHVIPIAIEGNFQISLCYGNCGYAAPEFSLSAISVKRFGTDTITCDRCSIFNGNSGLCENNNCEYDVTTQKCQSSILGDTCKTMSLNPCLCVKNGCRYDTTINQCVIDNDDFFKTLTCRREGHHYVFPPNLFCKNDVSTDCTNGTTVYGVNVNGDDYIAQNGLFYKKDTPELVLDPLDIKRLDCPKKPCSLEDISEDDFKKLYGSLTGKVAKMNTGACLFYPIVLSQDGEYELIITMLENVYTEEKQRCFTIKINDIPIATGIDLFKLSGKDRCGTVDLSVFFVVQNYKTSMRIKGHANPLFIFGGFNLQFCFGSTGCEQVPDKAFTISAFNIVRFGDDTVVPDNMGCNRHNNTAKIILPCEKYTSATDCPKINCTFDSVTKQCYATPEITPLPYHPCQEHQDVFACSFAGCQFDVVENRCVYALKDCMDSMFPDALQCRRKDAFYASSGVLCKNSLDSGECSADKIETKLALNLGGKAWSHRGIEYDEEAVSDIDGRSDHCRSATSVITLLHCSNSDKSKLASVVYGGQEKKRCCIIYPFSLGEDGLYEISVFSVEGAYKYVNGRSWDIQFNEHTLLYNIDLFRLKGAACDDVELVILFKLQNYMTEILFQGFKDTIKINGTLQLKFCNSFWPNDNSLRVKDNRLQVSAFSISKLVTTEPPVIYDGPTNPCKKHGSDRLACKLNNCEFNLAIGLCDSKITACQQETLDEFRSCTRKGEIYGIGGVLCRNKNTVTKGDCAGESALALNLHGSKVWYPPRNMWFFQETSNHYHSTAGAKVTFSNEFDCPEKYSQDSLFKNMIGGGLRGSIAFVKEGCFTYPVRIGQDGNYELTFFGTEAYYKYPNLRYFDVKINFLTVLYAVDWQYLIGRSCRATHINVLFKVTNGQTQLTPIGFPTSIPIQKCYIDVKICYGYDGSTSKGVTVSAFSVIWFKNG